MEKRFLVFWDFCIWCQSPHVSLIWVSKSYVVPNGPLHFDSVIPYFVNLYASFGNYFRVLYFRHSNRRYSLHIIAFFVQIFERQRVARLYCFLRLVFSFFKFVLMCECGWVTVRVCIYICVKEIPALFCRTWYSCRFLTNHHWIGIC